MPVATDRSRTPRAPEAIERFVKQLVVTHKAVGLYPAASAIPRENASIALGQLRGILQTRGEMRLGVAKEGLSYEGVPVFPEQPAFTAFALELYNRNISEIRFHAGVRDSDLIGFFEGLQRTPSEIASAGGFEHELWEREIDAITVVVATTRIVDAEVPEGAESPVPPGEPWPPDARRIDELLVGAFGGRPRDQRVLVRVVESPELVREYLRETVAGRGSRPAAAVIESHLTSLAHIVRNELPADQPALFRSLAEALMELDPELRAAVMRDKLLADARKDEALAEIVRSMRVDEVCSILVEGLTEEAASIEGVARAVRNLALISMAGREEVVERAEVAMRTAGVAPEVSASVLEGAAPARLRVRERPKTAEEQPIDSIVRLVDLTPAQRAVEGDADLEPLRVEARQGITDADIMGALVTLVTLDARAEPFAAVMSIVEDNLGGLLDRGEFEAAADAAAALVEAEKDRRLSTAQRRRVRNAMASLARTEQMRTINRAMRLFPSGSMEHAACGRLLSILGQHALDPLLELLAEEQDMAARKAMVDLISDLAPDHIDVLGERVNDRRWFFVRNVVAILGNTRSAEALPYLERTLRHGDARVRRETIRSASAIKDLRAEQMLAAALSDEDAQNVTLAARYLGTLASRGAVPSLEVVARGEGSGNREVGPRVEAIEALVRIAQPSSIDVLSNIATRRGGLLRREPREVTTAAGRAAAYLRSQAKGGAPT